MSLPIADIRNYFCMRQSGNFPHHGDFMSPDTVCAGCGVMQCKAIGNTVEIIASVYLVFFFLYLKDLICVILLQDSRGQ